MQKKEINLVLAVLLLILAVPSSAQNFLKTDGTRIVDSNGEEVIFRGIGLGGWMLQEGYMLGTSGPQHEIEAKIEELIGPEKTAQFYDAWLANHTRKIDVDSMAAWGYNMIRLPMHYKLFTPQIEEEPVAGEITWREKGFEMVDELLEWCKANNMYLILDMHAAPGGQGENADISDYDPSKPSLWESEANQEKMVALWRKLAERYADEPMMAAYDIINEPNWGFQNHDSDPNGCAETQNTPLWDLQKEITAAIREVDLNHIVIIEGNCWGNNYNGLPTLWDDNLVVSFHKYWNPNTVGAIQGMLNMRQNRNVPIWLGETGENSNTWFTNAIELFEDNNMGWSWWPLKKLGYNNPLQIKRNEGYQTILDYWNGSAAKPTEEEAFTALMQLTENLKLENNVFHPSVVDAMIRQPHSDEAIPFKNHLVKANENTIIYATDFDMGRHEIAYYDNEVQNTTGNAGGQAWNLGYSYRNDGVDIEPSQDEVTNGYNVGWIEDDEWMQYTIQVEEAGNYDLHVRTAGTNANGRISFSANGEKITEEVSLPSTGGYQEWQTTTVQDVPLQAGENVIRLTAETGGFNLNYFAFEGPKELSAEQPKILEGTGMHQDNKINILFNQDFAPVGSVDGFTVTYDGEVVDVTDAYLKDGTPRAIVLEVAEPLLYGTEVLVDYTGSNLTTINGATLDAFSDLEIELFVGDGIIPLVVPGRLQVENYTTNRGFEFEESTDAGGGQNAGYTNSGDYLDFLVMIDETGYYEVDFRVASLSAGGSLKVQLVDGETASDITSVSFDATGGWQTWATVTSTDVYLERGLQTIRLRATASDFNINWIEFSYLYTEIPLSALADAAAMVSIYPNPSLGSIYLVFNDDFQYPKEMYVYDMTGKKALSFVPDHSSSNIHINHNLTQGQYLLVFEANGRSLAKRFTVQ